MYHRIHPFQVYRLMIFSNFAEQQNYHHNNLEQFHFCSWIPYLTTILSPESQGTTNILSVSIDLPILDISYK